MVEPCTGYLQCPAFLDIRSKIGRAALIVQVLVHLGAFKRSKSASLKFPLNSSIFKTSLKNIIINRVDVQVYRVVFVRYEFVFCVIIVVVVFVLLGFTAADTPADTVVFVTAPAASVPVAIDVSVAFVGAVFVILGVPYQGLFIFLLLI